jgi:hypothetical protein
MTFMASGTPGTSGTIATLARLADAIAQRVDECPPVLRRSTGSHGTIATYLRGRRVDGIKFGDDGSLEVHVIVHWGCAIETVRSEVFSAIRSVFPGGEIKLVIDDIDLPPDRSGYATVIRLSDRTTT